MKPLKQRLGRSSNLSGRTFGRLTVVRLLPGKKKHERVWLCSCVCGNTTEATTAYLGSGSTRSCGCLQKEHWKKTSVTHGLSKTRIFNCFYGAKGRCTNKNNKKYKSYGARGIKVEWDSFESFLSDMKDSYEKHCKLHGTKNTTLER